HPSWTDLQPPDVYWYVFADQFLWQANQDVTRMIFLGRLPIVFLTLGLALVGFHFAREFWGRPSGYLAFFMLLFEPNILANGRLVTTDLGGTLFITLALLLVWRLWTAPSWAWRRWLAAGMGLGLAFGSKLSMLSFVLILALLALLPIYNLTTEVQRHRGVGRRLLQLITAGLVSVFVVWGIFGLEWGAFRFPSERLAFLNRFSGPMPTFWAGIDQIVNVSRDDRMAFLLGESSDQGFWLFFPVAFLVKTPLLLLLGLLLLIWVVWKRPPRLRGGKLFTRSKLLFLLTPALLYFLVSMVSGINIGYRHLLPILPLIIVGVSGLPTFFVEQPRLKRALFAVLALGLLLPSLLIHPHYLSYFNLAAGGPAKGAAILADSSNDWGQDLLRLQAWMAQNEVESIKLGWFGIADPAYYGIQNEPLPGFPRPEYLGLWRNPPFDPENPAAGLYAISASSLWETPLSEKGVYAWFRQRPPDARVGYSIYIFDVP
ncbi:MAG: phospholipid carrier-dependent glycosyltransferase, partial [Chloroflexi bacterium]|nr:phospholipid carrier-dependent glycosyltransferase [Chloroflexota bacterium]